MYLIEDVHTINSSLDRTLFHISIGCFNILNAPVIALKKSNLDMVEFSERVLFYFGPASRYTHR